jgi:hypothetical protein
MRTRTLTAALLLASLSAHPMTPGASVELSRHDYNASEKTATGSVLNQEKGWLTGIAAGIGTEGSHGRWTLQAEYERGEPDYQGMSQTGDALETTTQVRARRLSVRWAPPWQVRVRSVEMDGHAEVAHQRLDRNIEPTAQSLPLRESMATTWLRGGVRLHAPLSPAWSLHADAQLSWPLAQQLHVDTFGVYDPFELTPQRRLSNQIGAGIAWQPTPKVRVEFRATADAWRFGRSASRSISRGGEAAGNAEYPGSRQSLHGLRLKIEAGF